MREVKKIETVVLPPQLLEKRRVAVYARVSGRKDAALDSLSAQISHYSTYIQRRDDWEFAGIYADEAVTGTKERRAEFQRLLNDCRNGKVDMVVTKSISRFARNTVTLLETVRELKQLGIEVYFECENIHALSGEGELMLTILASFAQEESRSASENQKWRIRKMFQEGRPNTGRMLGYKLVDGVLTVIPKEAVIVRLIFESYLSGMGRDRIVKKLIELGIPTRSNARWNTQVIVKILKNEKYTGNMILQKTFRLDHVSKKQCRNNGELPKYHVKNSHEAIVDNETFMLVQTEMVRRAEYYAPKDRVKKLYPFTSIIRCGICGKSYRRKLANAGSKYQKPVWICPTFNVYGKDACSSQQIPESILMKVVAETLGLDNFCMESFAAVILTIHIEAPGFLRLVNKDGSEQQIEWRNPSRSESWTEDMRQAAREKALSMFEGRKNE